MREAGYDMPNGADPSQLFRELRELSKLTRVPELRVQGRDRLIRFLDSYSAPTVTSDAIVDSLCSHFGLYPYMSSLRSAMSSSEAIAYEFHRPSQNSDSGGFVFHEDQAAIYFRLLDGKNVILSAPTSFGKSAILDALIATFRWNNIVVIVPTIALIDEVRRRLVRFGDSYKLVTHPTQAVSVRNIYIMTQERYLELPRSANVDFFMIDEFYKLGSADTMSDQRTTLLNIAWNRLHRTGAQYYLAGPNIDSIAETVTAELRDNLYVSDYKTVAVDVDDRSTVPNDERLADLEEVWQTFDGSSLVFVSAPARAERIALEISNFSTMDNTSTRLTDQVSDWLAANYHGSWRVVQSLQGGVGVHTGPMPRSLQRMMIRLFSSGDIPALVCTTTLIEGVNTTAKNVVIYDKRISNKAIDYFTFSNVRGRAGRMTKHFVGNVVTYMAPPPAAAVEVDIPIESQGKSASISSLIQLPIEKLTGASRRRVDKIIEQTELSLETIRLNRGYDPESQIAAAVDLGSDRSLRRALGWSGFPTSSQARTVLEFAFNKLLVPSQRRGMNINKLVGTISSVRASQGKFSALIEQQMQYKRDNEDLSDVISSAFQFQRNWMGFTIPSMLKALQNIYNEVAAERNEPSANYDLYISQIENIFLPPALIRLDEYGLPLPLALRFAELGLEQSEDLDQTLLSLSALGQQASVRSYFSEVELWIIDDVLAGL